MFHAIIRIMNSLFQRISNWVHPKKDVEPILQTQQQQTNDWVLLMLDAEPPISVPDKHLHAFLASIYLELVSFPKTIAVDSNPSDLKPMETNNAKPFPDLKSICLTRHGNALACLIDIIHQHQRIQNAPLIPSRVLKRIASQVNEEKPSSLAAVSSIVCKAASLSIEFVEATTQSASLEHPVLCLYPIPVDWIQKDHNQYILGKTGYTVAVAVSSKTVRIHNIHCISNQKTDISVQVDPLELSGIAVHSVRLLDAKLSLTK